MGDLHRKCARAISAVRGPGAQASAHQDAFEHNTLWGGPLELTLNLASVIPDAMAEFVAKHLDLR